MPAATKVTTIWSLAKVRTHVKATATTHDDQIASLADGVSASIEKYIRRHVVERSVTEYPTCSPDGVTIRLANYPVQAVASVEYRRSLTSDWTTLDTADYELDGDTGTVYSARIGLPVGPRLVRVVYTSGFDAQDGSDLPADIYSRGLDWIKLLWNRWTSDTILATSTTEGQRSISVSGDIPKELKSVLDQYVKRRI